MVALVKIMIYSIGQAVKSKRLLSIEKRKKRMKEVYRIKIENCELITLLLWSPDKVLYFYIESRTLCRI